MAKRLILLFLIFLFIYACTPKPSSYESATKWYTECYPLYPKFHPGDWNAVEDDSKKECNEECNKKIRCIEVSSSCSQNINSCKNSCYEEIAKAHSVAYHVEGGYYSDGSYYAGCQPLYFRNIHPTADKYKKTKWQTDRDDCMKLTSENVVTSLRERKGRSRNRLLKLAPNYYKSCLKERGY